MAKPNPQDTLLVRNIDVDCSEATYDTIPTYYKEKDEESGEVYQRFGNKPYEFAHSNYFAVRWAGQEHRIKPGETRLMPRFLAEHYAKHLADHMLGKRELTEKKTGLITNAIERPKVLNQIIVKLVQPFEENGIDDEGLAALDEVQQLNRGLDLGNGETAMATKRSTEMREVDGGDVPNYAVGVLTTAAPRSLDETLEAAGETVEAKPLPSRAELLKEAHALGLTFDPKDTRESLAAKIKAF